MKAVILCAGEGNRLKPLTEKIPKPLILIKNNPILFYIFNSLPKEIDEVFLVIQEKYLDLFTKFLESLRIKIKIKILFQEKNTKGTYFALMSAKKFLKDENRFLVLNGDDLFEKEDVEIIIKMDAPVYGISYKKSDPRYKTCDLDVESKKIISFRNQKIEERGRKVPCFTGLYVLTKDFFGYPPVYVKEEAGIPHTLMANNESVSYLMLKKWRQINTLKELKGIKKILT